MTYSGLNLVGSGLHCKVLCAFRGILNSTNDANDFARLRELRVLTAYPNDPSGCLKAADEQIGVDLGLNEGLVTRHPADL
jgi:hypothetical protein